MMENFKGKSATSKYSEDWIPINQIANGMIQLETGEYVTGVKVFPKNIFIMDPETQDNIIFNFRNFYNMIDYEFWLIIADRPVDIDVYLSRLQIKYNESTDREVRKLITEDINKANLFMSAQYNVVDTEYYVLFKSKKQDEIQKRIHNLISGFANCSLSSSQVSNSDLRIVLDNFFNQSVSVQFRSVIPE